MEIYLPIAEIPVDMFLILGMGIAVGFISGMFGIGGGFLLTPLLIFVGVPPAVPRPGCAGQNIRKLIKDGFVIRKPEKARTAPCCCPAPHRGRRLSRPAPRVRRPARAAYPCVSWRTHARGRP